MACKCQKVEAAVMLPHISSDLISRDPLFCFRYRLEAPALKASIRAFGILTPLVIRRGRRKWQLVCGHKRFLIARALKIKQVPVVGIDPRTSDKDAFLANLVSNWEQPMPEVDRVLAVSRAIRVFRMNRDFVRDMVLPLVGLTPSPAVLDLCLRADGLPDAVKELFSDGRVPFRACAMLLRFKHEDQLGFASVLGKRIRLTTSQCLQSLEWLGDIIKRDGKCLLDVFRTSGIRAVLDAKGTDERMRGDRFFVAIRTLRFPGYAASLGDFAEKSLKAVAGEKGLRIDPVSGFEEPGIELRARLRTKEDLDRLLIKLAESKSSLNSLFDFKL